MSLQPIGYYLSYILEMKLGYRPVIFQLVFRKICFLSSGLKCASLKFWGDEQVSIEMLIISLMGATNISRQFFSTLVGLGFISHDFGDELKKSFLNLIFFRTFKNVHFGSNFCCTFKNVHFGSNFWFLHWLNIVYFIRKFGTDVSILSTQYLEKWSQS